MSTEATSESPTIDADKLEDGSHDVSAWPRQAAGLIGGIIVALLVYFFFPASAADLVNQAANDSEASFSYEAMRITAATAVLMGTWWMTESIPLAATALVPLVVFPVLQVVKFDEIATPYASPTIFLFMSGFILALTMQKWNLHRRLALLVVLAVGTKPRQLIAGFMLATGFLSMWVSNTATAVVMLPIGLSVLNLTAGIVGGHDKQRNFATSLMLAIAYSASIGSLGTIIGTPPNALLVAYLSDNHDVHIGFAQWMLVGIPLAVVFMILAWLVLTTVYKPEMKTIPGGREIIQEELNKMGSMKRGEILTAIVFSLAALSWIFIPIALKLTGSKLSIADSAIGMTAAILLFMIPVDKQGHRLVDWPTAVKLPWDVLLLFGGGLALSKMFSDSGLSLYIGELAKGLAVLPIILIIVAVTTLIIFLTEFTSNTATAAAFLPIIAGVAVGIGLTANGNTQNVLILTIPVALAATCAFMLPVATPPNAIAFGSGYVKIGEMIRGGLWLNILGIALITMATYLLAVPVFGLVL
ncbi:DASS family sodium-coupled anion symporter [Corynebacterium sp.]|uniref:SLC13 family permease n=1 Tax=Corynebacterium sp. TaxID=1720 RepID=UPI0026DC61A7|nr:DASS family sodium-coupled anion symporter [Corynebacterium sp.]MDO5077705.1 DASS family sodium-coupled anion symporter [Corynebacterium sp.]